MNIRTTKQINARIFVGFELTFELKKELQKSHLWKDSQFTAAEDPKALNEVHYQEKSYIGRLLTFNEVTLKDLDRETMEVLEKLNSYCPALKLDKNNTLVFPQVFVA